MTLEAAFDVFCEFFNGLKLHFYLESDSFSDGGSLIMYSVNVDQALEFVWWLFNRACCFC